eukprot:TRINITY_DN544_c0_g1_i1.p3 TRINITY_DN544_c0_g1~~TRINITY_DN544_c0_g1_i1.p3  ORF type:complete len:139 (-),score=71.12 TRINITY_DN544_c0_g1_i1:148-504(-)
MGQDDYAQLKNGTPEPLDGAKGKTLEETETTERYYDIEADVLDGDAVRRRKKTNNKQALIALAIFSLGLLALFLAVFLLFFSSNTTLIIGVLLIPVGVVTVIGALIYYASVSKINLSR